MAESEQPELIISEITTSETGEENKLVSNALKFLPLLSIILFAFSIFKQITYFNAFNLDILSFIDLNEAIVEYLSSLFYSCLFFILCFGSSILIVSQLRKHSKYREISHSFDVDIFMFYFVISVTLFFALSHILSFWTLETYSYNENSKLVCTMYLALVLGSLLIFYIPIKYFHKEIQQNDILKFLLYVFFVLIYSYTLVETRLDIYQTKLNSTIGTTFKSANKEFKSTPNFYYIGKTKNYVFYYDAKNASPTVYQMKDLTSLTLVDLNITAAHDSVKEYYKRKFSKK